MQIWRVSKRRGVCCNKVSSTTRRFGPSPAPMSGVSGVKRESKRTGRIAGAPAGIGSVIAGKIRHSTAMAALLSAGNSPARWCGGRTARVSMERELAWDGNCAGLWQTPGSGLRNGSFQVLKHWGSYREVPSSFAPQREHSPDCLGRPLGPSRSEQRPLSPSARPLGALSTVLPHTGTSNTLAQPVLTCQSRSMVKVAGSAHGLTHGTTASRRS